MTTPSNFGGLSSGVQWNDIVDSTVNALKARTVTPITDRVTLRDRQKAAWTTLRGLVETLNQSALNIRREGFGGFSATAPNSAATGRTLLAATTSPQATAGRYRVEVLQVAETAKIGGATASDTAAARGLVGTFSVNGSSISVVATDSLTAIRDKINQANAGVSASIVSEGGTAGRLVVTSAASGSAGITIGDGSQGLARELGFLESRSRAIPSAIMAAAAAMGMSVIPQPATIRVGNVTITADLSTQSLMVIAAKINAAGGSATVQSEVFGNETRYRLLTDGNVTAVAGDADSQAVIDALGFAAGGYGGVPQTVQTAIIGDAGGSAASATTPLTALTVGGSAPGLSAGDAINIRGTRGDGTAVTYGLVVQAGDTVQTLLDRINDGTSGFGAGSRPATATLGADGRIRLTDDVAGVSRLSLSLSIARADGTTGTLASTTTAIAGRSREQQQGRDAVVVVDGQSYTRSTNTLTDVVPGVTLSLRQAEVGTPVELDVSRDEAGATSTAKQLVEAYNAVAAFFDEQRVVGAPLYADSSLRRLMGSFTEALRTEVSGNGTYSRAANVGMALDRNGRLTLDEAAFRSALADKPSEVTSLFSSTGIGGAFVTSTDNATRFGIGAISVSVNNIASDVAKLRGREAEATRRIEARRAQLVEQFTRMEEAMSRLQAQGGSLAASLKGLQSQQR